MQKGKNMSKTNYKFNKKNWLVVAVSVVLSLVTVACVFNITDSFTEFNPVNIVMERNEDNLFFEQIEDGTIYDNKQIDCVVKNGEITLDGTIVNSNPGTITMSDSIAVATLKLKPGTYTLSCFTDPNIKSHYFVGTYVKGDLTYTWYADFEEAPNNADASKLLQGQTIELTEETTVNFEIRLVEGAELKNAKARPVLVEGDKEGKFFNIGLLG